MPTNRPNEDRYGSAFQEQASKEAIQKYNREKNKDHLGKKSADLDERVYGTRDREEAKRRARFSIPIPTAEDLEYLGSEQSRKDRRTVIEKLTAPPETLLEHAKRIGVEIHQDKTEVLGLPFYYFSKDQLDAAEGRQ